MSERVATLWGQVALQKSRASQPLGWLDSSVIQTKYVDSLLEITNGQWLLSLMERLQISKNGRWLSIGCGHGSLEIYAAKNGLCTDIQGIDIAEEAIAIARRLAAENSLSNAHFHTANVEEYHFPENTYDVILCPMSLHHIRRLEFFLEEATYTLREGGYIIANEFIGPSQWQWSDTQVKIINTLLSYLPERYRIHTLTGQIKCAIERPTIAYMNAVDPSESIRSAEIVPLLAKQFTIIEQKNYGGPILHQLLENIVSNFSIENALDIEIIELLCGFEQACISSGILKDEFTLITGKNTKKTLRVSQLPFDASLERYIVSGTYPIEYDSNGHPFFWTAQEAHFILHCPAHSSHLFLRLSLPPVTRYISFTIDGVMIGLITSLHQKKVGQTIECRFHLPPNISSNPMLSISIDQTWCPKQEIESSDKRQLGIAIKELAFL